MALKSEQLTELSKSEVGNMVSPVAEVKQKLLPKETWH